MKVQLTAFAKSELRKIYDYYAEVASVKVAQNIKNKILKKALSLKTFSEKGQVEFLLEELQQNHRYLITGNYKIIYLIRGNIVYITDIFDCRQDPEKLPLRNK